MKKCILFFATFLLLQSCANFEDPNYGESNSYCEDYFVNLDNAKIIAQKKYNELFGINTRGDLNITDVEQFKFNTRSNTENLYGYYILNFDNNSGFAIVSADTRREEILAISNESSLHLRDTIDNVSLSWYLNDHLDQLDKSITIGNKLPIDTVYDGPYIPEQGKTVFSEPLIPITHTKFHQGYPYNQYCFTIDGQSAMVGCLPLAVSTVIGYNNRYTTIDNLGVDWSAMWTNPYNVNSIGQFYLLN